MNKILNVLACIILLSSFRSLNENKENKMKNIYKYKLLEAGSIQPKGWIKEQLKRDLVEGYIGRYDEVHHGSPSIHTCFQVTPSFCPSLPSKRTSPDVGRRKPSSSWASVDLPLPEAPTTATNSPAEISIETPRSTSPADPEYANRMF